MSGIASTPEPPYYAVIFASQRTKGDNGYGNMAKKMEELASGQKGFLGIESARDNELGITVSYWDSMDAIKSWKDNAAHRIAQNKGQSDWYINYSVKICKVEGAYSFEMD
ncbi:antibiotic biosynthesis monooxygenase family protein [Psychrobacillus psychrodurans]|uniref:antibiotic biosynthesis monooxygenase family protein n=1 Tax=Psychrobacillus psychrodurans TaxID=126157 RepID=UPI003D06EC2D